MERGDSGGGDTAMRGHGDSDPRDDGADRGGPLSGFSSFSLFPEIPAGFWYLIEAFKHFEKSWKNSCRLPLPSRSFTKIGVAN